ncbi:MAG: ATP synthase F1 subunit gamma [Candidatus Marinimicrobia bacterium]|nr:ATP synthase F1 subunit gamma [Candidatus Neomarinimicrobiota bacterium]
MASLKDIRRRIGSVKSIQQVTKAMKMVAAAKLRRAQINMLNARPYARRVRQVLASLLPQIDRELLPVLQVRGQIGRSLIVVVTSDRGMAAGFNSTIIKAAQTLIDELGRDNVDLLCIGKKGRDYFTRRDYAVAASYVDFWSELSFDHAMELGREIVSRYVNGSVDQVWVVFNQFVNVLRQEIKRERLLPLVVPEGEALDTSEVLFEPSMEAVVDSLVPRHLNIQVWRYLLESFASEQAARMTAMENATNNAGEVIEKLQLKYNNARQAGITKEILDIVGGAEALRTE